MLEKLLERFRGGDRLALARLVSLVARGEQVEGVLAGLPAPPGPARVVAITGSGGVGKSTLTGKLVEVIRAQGLRVAVLACDPESPLSGGAILGDRFRMPVRADDAGVYTPPRAAAGAHGALAEHLPALIRLLESFGFEVILLETVGAGQGDTAVHALADVLVLLLQPETGDDLQWEKAGLLEVADVVVIHKADLPGADRVEAQVLGTLGLGEAPAVPVLRVSSRGGEGITELWQAGQARSDRDLLAEAQETLALRFAALRSSPDVRQLLTRWRGGEVATEEAVRQLLDLLWRA